MREDLRVIMGRRVGRRATDAMLDALLVNADVVQPS
jgi:hypothetical protein